MLIAFIIQFSLTVACVLNLGNICAVDVR